jgi:hypothetical protein
MRTGALDTCVGPEGPVAHQQGVETKFVCIDKAQIGKRTKAQLRKELAEVFLVVFDTDKSKQVYIDEVKHCRELSLERELLREAIMKTRNDEAATRKEQFYLDLVHVDTKVEDGGERQEKKKKLYDAYYLEEDRITGSDHRRLRQELEWW